ncbi:sensor histidine kinase [Cellulomonas marina]|uniref:histidine kinase n=1 Tax=Cellulomonas marina TaxID=988821 RepID=A0A1I0WJ17_9CELL|nr:HAMP domain-containing sensor histidine kinase [Cellulomonas marina]GIG27693.1 two-component sensor histidine kinase [Cellulomonas marina]SFA88765.1 two-component system, OmpR family, sensor kinase [Cellulomonas marina]
MTQVLPRLRARWDEVPLRVRLVALVVVLLLVGLSLAGAVSSFLLARTLAGQVDDKLQSEGGRLAETAWRNAVASSSGIGGSTGLPTDYCVWVSVPGYLPVYFRSSSAEEYGTPDLPTLTAEQATARAGEPFTIRSDHAGSTWRAVAYPVVSGGADVGTVVVALPLGEAKATADTMLLAVLLSGVSIVVLGALVGGWAVQRSLRPLRDIEATAAAIAAGDLSRRVPTAPPGTEVGRLGGALNGMLGQIERAFDARTASEARMRRFVADASHELRTPLAAIRGYGELYRMGAITRPEQLEDTMRRIEGSATRMGTLVEDLLSLARLDEQRELARAPVDLTVLAADALADLHALDPARPVRILALPEGAPSGPCVVLGDEVRLRQVLANLVGNVVQHTPAGVPVELAVGTDPALPGAGVLEVRDHGPGIPPEHAARVFERFYRVDASRGRASGGAGLGMAIVAAIVEAHGGTVGLQPTPGGGTTVRVVLPTPPPGEAAG